MTGARGLAWLVDGCLRVPRAARAIVPITGMAILWWSSSRVPGDEPASTMRALAHNSMHIVAYAALAASLWLTLATRPAEQARTSWAWWAWSLAVLYGVVDEWHQSFVPGRDSSVADVCSDALGAALAVVLLRAVVGALTRWRVPLLLLILSSVASVGVATFGS